LGGLVSVCVVSIFVGGGLLELVLLFCACSNLCMIVCVFVCVFV